MEQAAKNIDNFKTVLKNVDDFGKRVVTKIDDFGKQAADLLRSVRDDAYQLADGIFNPDFGKHNATVIMPSSQIDEGLEASKRFTLNGGGVSQNLSKYKSFDENLMADYLKDIESWTSRNIPSNQLEELDNALKSNEYSKLSPVETSKHRAKFNEVKDNLISEWEQYTGQEWPTYTEDVLGKNGKIVRRAGDKYDAHHIIENSFGGQHEWWNIHPAKFPNEHQAGIHGGDSISRNLFK